MIVNTTFVVNNDITAKWQKWLKTMFATSVSDAGMSDMLVMKVVGAPSEAEGAATFAVQLRGDAARCRMWTDNGLPAILSKMGLIWGEKALHFTTVMEEVEL